MPEGVMSNMRRHGSGQRQASGAAGKTRSPAQGKQQASEDRVSQPTLDFEHGAYWANLYTDGASLGNPGAAGIGVVLTDEQGNLLKEMSEPIGITTNNEAEYHALIRGLELARQLQITHLNWYSDSELVVKQVLGEYKVKQPHLMRLLKQAREHVKAFTAFHPHHIPREQNTQADRLSKEGASAVKRSSTNKR
ncbi:MAG: ribonuclease HI family protein [Fimbriimonadales bacterium]